MGRAGLQGDVKCGVTGAVMAPPRISQGEDFGVGLTGGTVPAAADLAAAPDQHGSDGGVG